MSLIAPPALSVAERFESSDEPARQAGVPVLHVINGEHYSGAERVQDLLAMRLPELGFSIDFACLKPGRFAQLREAHDARVFDLPMRGRIDIRPAVRLASLIRREGYQIVHTHTPRAAIVGRLAATLTGVPMVHHLHSPTTADSTHVWRNYVNAALERLSLPRSVRVIAVSQSLGKYARRLALPESAIAVVTNGVRATDRLTDRPAPQRHWTLGSVALFRPRKGLEVLLESLALLRTQGHSVSLRAVGAFETAEYQIKIEQLVERLGLGPCVEWVGFTRDVPRELAQLDMMVLPSLFGEGLPMVVLEAMAQGVPVVATRVEGVPEVIHDGQDGVLAAPDDADDLTRAIGRLLSGQLDWNQLRTNAHRRQAESFSDLSMARGVAQVYREVLAR